MELKEVVKAKSLEEVLELLDKNGDKAKILAGGTDLIIAMRHKRVSPESLIDISDVKEMSFISENGDYVEIGTATNFTDIANSKVLEGTFNGLKEAALSVGSPQIRNRGTIGGNICNGSPAADTVPPLLAAKAIGIIKSKNGTREVELDKFFVDKGKVDLKPNEVLFSVKFKKAENGQGLGFSKLGLRKALAISRLSVAVFVEVDGSNVCKKVRVASGSLGKFPMREREVEEFLLGKVIDEKTITEASDLYKDVIEKRLAGRYAAEFKSEAVKGIFKDAINKALSYCK
jgi:CO/xanthine dehydrogenase FAD-binding subunit